MNVSVDRLIVAAAIALSVLAGGEGVGLRTMADRLSMLEPRETAADRGRVDRLANVTMADGGTISDPRVRATDALHGVRFSATVKPKDGPSASQDYVAIFDQQDQYLGVIQIPTN